MLRFLALCTLFASAAANPAEGLALGSSVVPFGSGGGAAANSATNYVSTADLDGTNTISCYEFEGIRCEHIYRSHPSDTLNTGSSVVVTSAASTYPSVKPFDERNALVCYTTSGTMKCNALHLKTGNRGDSGTLTAGSPVNVAAADQPTVATWDPRGAPRSWAARRAIACYVSTVSPSTSAPGRGMYCVPLSLTFPVVSSGGWSREDGNVAGILTVGTAKNIVVTAAGDWYQYQSRYYTGPRIFNAKGLTTLDYFNAILCYSTPTALAVSGADYYSYYTGDGKCTSISTDIPTGQVLTVLATSTFHTGRTSDIAVTAFKPKSGDPTRALVCYITQIGYPFSTGGAAAGTGFNSEYRCTIAQRKGNGLTYLNSQRDAATGFASDGTTTDTLVYKSTYTTPAASTAIVKDATIASLDEYNAMVCYTLGSYNVANQCSYPSSNVAACGDGLHAMAGKGTLHCRQLWIHGWGSSTYNSAVYNGVASPSGPVNVGSVQGVVLGPVQQVTTTNVKYPYLVGFDGHHAAYCATNFNTPNRGTCQLLRTKPADNVWQFNAPVDCVNGYGCPSSAAACTYVVGKLNTQACPSGYAIDSTGAEAASRTSVATYFKTGFDECLAGAIGVTLSGTTLAKASIGTSTASGSTMTIFMPTGGGTPVVSGEAPSTWNIASDATARWYVCKKV